MRGRGLLVLLLLAALLIGCGGGGDQETTSSSATSAEATSREADAREEDDTADSSGSEEKGEASDEASIDGADPNPPIATERTPGSKAVAPGVPTTKGGDNSIQAFGLEGEDDEAAQATESLRAYLDARAQGDWQGACAAASEEFRDQLETLIERSKVKGEGQKPEGCAETLELLFGKTPRQALEESAEVNRVLSFRVEEDGYAYLIYEDADEAIRFIAMADDNGTWKVNTIEPTEFPEPEEQGSNQ